MAAALHGQLGKLTKAIPIEAIARALDITEVRKEEMDGCEGVLLTDRMRSYGKILVNTRGGAGRARFSVAHELGHFLLESHELSDASGFVCNGADMREGRERTRHQKQEREANQFAIEMLAPAYRMAPYLPGDPDLRTAGTMSRDLEISREAAVRRYIELHDEPLAAVMTRHQVVRYVDWNDRFPRMKVGRNDAVPSATHAHRAIAAGRTGVTRFRETYAAAWLQDPDIELFEQTRVGQGGFATTLFWASIADPEAEDDGVAELSAPAFQKPRRR